MSSLEEWKDLGKSGKKGDEEEDVCIDLLSNVSRFTKPSPTASFDGDPELIVGNEHTTGNNLPSDSGQSNPLRYASGSGSRIRTHRRSLSTSSIPAVKSFVNFERPDLVFATYPRPRSASKLAAAHRRQRSASAHHRRTSSASMVTNHRWSFTLCEAHEDAPEEMVMDPEDLVLVVSEASVYLIKEDAGHHELVVNSCRVHLIEDRVKHEFVVNSGKVHLIGDIKHELVIN